MRTFLAVDLPEDLKDELDLMLDELRVCSRSVRWIKKQAMHITVKFLGEISSPQSEQVCSLLEEIAAAHSSFSAKLQGTGVFPEGARTPRVLWVGIEENEALQSLQNDLETGLASIGFPKERRRFHPHLTLGRVKSTSGLDKALSFLDEKKDWIFGQWEACSVTFFQSILRPSGAEYHILKDAKLRG